MNAPEPSTLAPAGRVLGPMLCAAALEALAWGLLLPGDALAGGWYGRPELLRAAHALAIGVLGLSLLGAGWQIVPVITVRPWPSGMAPALAAGLVAGLGGMIWGFGRGGPWGHAGAACVALVMALRGGWVLGAMLRSTGRPAARAWIAGAELCGLAGLVLGVLLWAGRSGAPSFADPIAGIGRHAGLLVGGLFGGWMIGAGAVLLPMFAVAKEPSERALLVAAVPWFAGVGLGIPWVWLLGALVAVGALLTALGRGARRGPALLQAAAGLVGLGLAGLAAGLFGPGAADGAPVFAAFALGVLPILRGVAQRIGPFFAWSHAAKGGLRGAPPPARFADERWMWAQLALALAGGALLVGGRAAAAPELARLGVALLFTGAWVQLAILGRAALLAALLSPLGGPVHVDPR